MNFTGPFFFFFKLELQKFEPNIQKKEKSYFFKFPALIQDIIVNTSCFLQKKILMFLKNKSPEIADPFLPPFCPHRAQLLNRFLSQINARFSTLVVNFVFQLLFRVFSTICVQQFSLLPKPCKQPIKYGCRNNSATHRY